MVVHALHFVLWSGTLGLVSMQRLRCRVCVTFCRGNVLGCCAAVSSRNKKSSRGRFWVAFGSCLILMEKVLLTPFLSDKTESLNFTCCKGSTTEKVWDFLLSTQKEPARSPSFRVGRGNGFYVGISTSLRMRTSRQSAKLLAINIVRHRHNSCPSDAKSTTGAKIRRIRSAEQRAAGAPISHSISFP